MTLSRRFKDLAAWAYWTAGAWLFNEREPQAEEVPSRVYQIQAAAVMVVFTPTSQAAQIYTAQSLPALYSDG